MSPLTGTRKPHVLLLNSVLHFGGAENVVAELVRGLNRDKFDVSIAHLKPRGRLGDALADEGYDVISLAPENRRSAGYLGFLRLRRFVKDHRVDLIHSNDPHAMMDGALCRILRPGLRLVNTFHFGNYPRPDRRQHLMEKYLSRVPDRLVAVGEAQRSTLLESYGLRADRIQVVRNGVSDVRARANGELQQRIRQGKPVVIGCVGALIEQKGIHDLLEAAALLKAQAVDFRLVIAGDGHLRSQLESHADQLGLKDEVEFLGWIDDAPTRVLPWIDIFVQTSLWEAMPMVVLEAMSCGLPIVATTVGENPLVIDDTVNGYLVPPHGIGQIVERLRVLVTSDSLRSQLGDRARQDWEQRYTAAQMCRRYEELYSSLLGFAPSAPPRTDNGSQ